MIEFEKKYTGFQPEDLCNIHPDYYEKLNIQIAKTNQKLKNISMALIPHARSRGSPSLDWEQRLNQLQDERRRLEAQNQGQIEEMKRNHRNRIASLQQSVVDLEYRARSSVPDRFGFHILSHRFSDDQEERVRKVKGTVYDIWKRLQVFDRTMKSDPTMKVRAIMSADQVGKSFEDYHGENIDHDYPSQWHTVSHEIERNSDDLVSIRQQISDFFKEHDDLLSVDQRFVLNIKKRKFPDNDEEKPPSVWYSYQGKKRRFYFDDRDLTVGNWKKELSQDLKIMLNRLRLKKANNEELRDQDLLMAHKDQYIKVTETNK